MIKGSHNSLTGHPLAGWQKYFGFLIKPFSKCQKEHIMTQYHFDNVRLFDIQVSGSCLSGSHGVARYDVEANYVLDELNARAERDNEKVYIMLGLDNYWFQSDSCKDPWYFKYLVHKVRYGSYPHLKLVRAYIERPWKILYEDKELANDMFEKYWSLSWAKSMMKHWWQFYYYLPIPRLWKHVYGKQWDKEAEESGKKFYVTDFV